MIKHWLQKTFILMMLVAGSCKEPFDPPIPATQTNYLVVEGFINATGTTMISLSRTLPVKDTTRNQPETKAFITIEGEDNSGVEVHDIGDGKYASDSVNLNANQKYRLHIKTVAGGEYLSEYVAVKTTPPIDSVNWKPENNGVRIFVNTHDPQNNTRYYKWNYQETWEIHSAYVNSVKYENGQISTRTTSEIEKLYRCWQSLNSVSILLGSTAQLAGDVVKEAPITFIPVESEKVSVRYSISVQQYSLDRKAYDFYQLVKSNTESLGSVFDPLPSDVTGNVTCVSNPREKVIGYIPAATVETKRIFISKDEVQSTFGTDCTNFYVVNNQDSLKLYFDIRGFRPYQPDGAPPGPVKGYYSSEPRCIDCTLRGSSDKPSFW